MARALQTSLELDGIRVLPLSCDDYYWPDWTPDALYGYATPAGIDSVALPQSWGRSAGNTPTAFGATTWSA